MQDISKIIFCLYEKKFKGIINIASGKGIFLKNIAIHISRYYKKKIKFKDNYKETYLVANINKLKKIYKNNRLGFLLSKYGGKLINLFILGLYNTSISDPFTSIKAFDAKLLKSLSLNRKGFAVETKV